MMDKFNLKRIKAGSLPFMASLAVLVTIIFVSAFFYLKYFAPKYSFEPNMSIEEKKDVVSNLVNRSRSKKIPLSPAEKESIFRELGGTKALQYNLTAAEQRALINALNGVTEY